MRIYIMTDMEGVAGVSDWENYGRPEFLYYKLGKTLLTEEVNAAIEGFGEAGVTEFLVADGHGRGGVDIELLDPRAELARYWLPAAYPFAMDDGKFDFAAWIGQHPKAGAVGGHLCHTGSFNALDMEINNISVGEFGSMVFCAGELGIRSIFVSGCTAMAQEAQALIPGIETVTVKRGRQTDPGNELSAEAYARHTRAAIHLAPLEARRRIRAGARRAVERALNEEFGIIALAPPFTRRIVSRPSQQGPGHVAVASHPRSVIKLMNTAGRELPMAVS